jgi:ABC-type transporter Mla subunit MlaD
MSVLNDGANRRADLLDRLQETGDRHDAAELKRTIAKTDQGRPEEALLRAAEELMAVAAEVRQMVAEIRRGFAELLGELRGDRRR